MTETEYVQTLRTAAQNYIGKAIAASPMKPGAKRAIERWEHLKTSMSAHTLIELADAWLAKNAAGGPSPPPSHPVPPSAKTDPA